VWPLHVVDEGKYTGEDNQEDDHHAKPSMSLIWVQHSAMLSDRNETGKLAVPRVRFSATGVGHQLHLKHRKETHLTPGDKVENFALQNQDGNAPQPGV